MAKEIIILNNRECQFEPGQTILEAAEANGIRIPTLCHLKGTAPTGRCKICDVEIRGKSELVSACETPAAAGMSVYTESPKVVESRRNTLNQFLLSGNHVQFQAPEPETGKVSNFMYRKMTERKSYVLSVEIAVFRTE